MRYRQWGTALAVLTTSLALGVPAASAAAPSNDLLAGATTIGALPFGEVVDTSQATTDADDTAINATCGAPVTNGSVWYSFTAPAGVDGIVVDISASNFSAGAIIAHSEGGDWFVDGCGPGITGAAVVEGVQYSILAFSDTPGVTGGTLDISVDAASIPTVSLTVNPKGKVDRFGNALISGTVTCAGGDFTDLYVSLRQAVGRFAITGDGYSGTGCDGSTQSWTAVVTPYNGKFAGGKAASFTYAFSCGAVFCADGYVEKTVKLSK